VRPVTGRWCPGGLEAPAPPSFGLCPEAVESKSHGPLAGPEPGFRFQGPLLRASSQTWAVASSKTAMAIFLGAGPPRRAAGTVVLLFRNDFAQSELRS
jgi:hypothetical protein